MSDIQKVGEYVVKLSGKATIPDALDISSNYKVVINGTVTAKTESDNNDGTSTVYYKLEPVNVELIDTLGTSIKSKDTRGKSKLLRSRLYVIWRDLASTEEFEDFYDGVMGQILFDANHIVDKYENRKK